MHFINWAAIQPHSTDEGRGDLFTNMAKNVEALDKPAQLKRKAEEERLANIIKAAEANHAEEIQGAKSIFEQNKAKYAEKESLAHIESLLAGAYNQRKHGDVAGLTEIQRDIGSVFKPGTPEYDSAMRDALGIAQANEQQNVANPETRAWVENSYPVIRLPKLAQRDAFQENKKLLDHGIAMTEALKSVQTAQKLLADHGDLNGGFEAYLLNPDSNNMSFWDFAKTRAVNEADRTAIQKMSKVYNDIVLGMEAATGLSRSRVTDSLRDLIISTKAQIGNTKDSNLFILNNLAEKMSEGPELQKAARWATKNRRGLQRNPGAFRPQKTEEEKAGDALKNAEGSKERMVTIEDDVTGERKTVTESEARRMGAQ